MSSEVDKTTIITFQGDSCPVTFVGLTDLVGETICLGVRDIKSNEPIFDELKEVVDINGDVRFEITPEMSNEFNVKPAEGFKDFFYGIKQINLATGEENTILLGDDPKFSDKYYLRAYLKKAEGIEE